MLSVGPPVCGNALTKITNLTPVMCQLAFVISDIRWLGLDPLQLSSSCRTNFDLPMISKSLLYFQIYDYTFFKLL